MPDLVQKMQSPLFEDIHADNLQTMLGCTGYHIGTYCKVKVAQINHSQYFERPLGRVKLADYLSREMSKMKTVCSAFYKRLYQPSPCEMMSFFARCCICNIEKGAVIVYSRQNQPRNIHHTNHQKEAI